MLVFGIEYVYDCTVRIVIFRNRKFYISSDNWNWYFVIAIGIFEVELVYVINWCGIAFDIM